MALTNSRRDTGVGVSREIASSIPKRNVRMRMRTLTSQANHSRSSNMDCMAHPNSRALSLGNAVATTPAIRTPWQKSFSIGQNPLACRSPARNSAHDFSCLAGQLGDHREQWHIQRNDDAADCYTQEGDQDWFQHGQHVLGRRIDFVFV